ncbi:MULTISPECIES: glycoside hydrolase family 25 protein [unclassified Aureispira]|uniref:glycoside hydrolase family 25 protein n=1 Tax=unclassified Aureispira TaxID=2649989 RepID=UPI0006990188|nr:MULTISPECIES: GH25 family lysozyme [unclassified Aureispira]WMX15467.1 GH25 family lysozyme [Aureispira sp. CCB-E]
MFKLLVYSSFLCLVFFMLISCTHDADQYKIQGIDVSHYQKIIDWETVAQQDKIHFAFIKATESTDYQDSIFENNWSKAKEVGLIRGAYHFFRPNVSIEWQIKNFTQQVQLSKGDLPPVLDVEDFKNVSMPTLIERVRLWLSFVEEHYQVRPIIYTSLKVYEQHLKGAFPDHPVWIARYNRKEPPQDINWLFWQYSNTEELEGIVGYVDKNVFVGTRAELQALCIP